jgi:hypothetical protein
MGVIITNQTELDIQSAIAAYIAANPCDQVTPYNDGHLAGYNEGYAKYPIDHPCDQITPYNNGYAQYPIDHPVIPPPPVVDRGSLEFFNLYHGNMILQAIKRDGTQLGADIALSAIQGGNYKYFDHNYFISNDVTIIRVNTDVVLKDMEIISYDLGSNAPKALSPTHVTASPEHINLGNTWDCVYYPDLKTQYVFSVASLVGSMDLFCGYTGGVSVQPITNTDQAFGASINMGDLSSGGVYKFFNKQYFVDNNIKLLRCKAYSTNMNGPLTALSRYCKISLDSTNNKIFELVALPAPVDDGGGNMITTFDLIWSPNSTVTINFFDGTY